MKIRKTARVICLDEEKRVLLIKIEDKQVTSKDNPNHQPIWVTPGGALLDSESFEKAAKRELWEETGISHLCFGPCLWIYEHQLKRKGEPLYLHERFYLGHVKRSSIRLENLTEEEKVVYCSHYWWTIDEISQSQDRFSPSLLGDYLLPILSGHTPVKPIYIR